MTSTPSKATAGPAFKRNDFVEYKTPLGHRVLAVVRRVHRDDSYTVESRFFLNKAGKPERGYLGYSFRLLRAAISRATGEA